MVIIIIKTNHSKAFPKLEVSILSFYPERAHQASDMVGEHYAETCRHEYW
jgi:hypothetical protein